MDDEILHRMLNGYLGVYGFVDSDMLAAYARCLQDCAIQELQRAIEEWVKNPATGGQRFKPIDILKIVQSYRMRTLAAPVCELCKADRNIGTNGICIDCRAQTEAYMHALKMVSDYHVNWVMPEVKPEVVTFCERYHNFKKLH